MKDTRDLKQFLGMDIRTEKGIYLCQTNYLHMVCYIWKDFACRNAKDVKFQWI